MSLFVKGDKPAVELSFFRKNDKTYYDYTQGDGYCGFRINYQIHQMIKNNDFTITSDERVKPSDHEFLAFLENHLPKLLFDEIKVYAAKDAKLPRSLWYNHLCDEHFSVGLNHVLSYIDTYGGKWTPVVRDILANKYKYLYMNTSAYENIVQLLSTRATSIVCNESVHFYFLKPLESQKIIFKRLVSRAVSELFRRRDLILESFADKAATQAASTLSSSCEISVADAKRQRLESNIKTGWLNQVISSEGAVSRLFFVLNNSQLTSFADEEASVADISKAKEQINLTEHTTVQGEYPVEDHLPVTMCIVASGTTLRLQASDDDELFEWFKALLSIIKA